MPFFIPLFVGLAAVPATATTVAAVATPGLIGFGGAITAGGVFAAGGAITSGVMGYQGSRQAGQAAAQQGKTEQEILNYNASLKNKEALAEEERARAEALRFGKEADVLKGRQRVQLARGGVLSTEGTPAMLLEQTAIELEADRKQILKEGYLAGSFRRSEAISLRFQGSAARAKGANIRTASRYQSYGSLLTGIGGGLSAYSSAK